MTRELRLPKGLLIAEHKCDYEHGFLPTTRKREKIERHLENGRAIVGWLRGDSCALDQVLFDHRFPWLATDQRHEA
jgi:hypothetical protein